MRRLPVLVSMAMVLPAFAMAPAPALRRGTTIEVADIVITPSGGGPQTIQISSDDLNQPVTVTFAPRKPLSLNRVDRGGNTCQDSGDGYVCPGGSDTVWLYYYSATEAQEIVYEVVATTPDGGFDVGTVDVQIAADVEVHPVSTGWVEISEDSPEAMLSVAIRNNGPYTAYGPVVAVSGVNPSRGVPAGCQLNGDQIRCVLGDIPYPHPINRPRPLEIFVPECSMADSVTVSVQVFQTDPDPANNTFVVPGIPGHPGCTTSGGSSGGSGGGSGGTGGGGQSAPSTSAGAPSTTVSASSSPTLGPSLVVVAGAGTTPAEPIAGTDHGPSWGWFAAGFGIVVGLALGGLGGWWVWRRRYRPGNEGTRGIGVTMTMPIPHDD